MNNNSSEEFLRELSSGLRLDKEECLSLEKFVFGKFPETLKDEKVVEVLEKLLKFYNPKDWKIEEILVDVYYTQPYIQFVNGLSVYIFLNLCDRKYSQRKKDIVSTKIISILCLEKFTRKIETRILRKKKRKFQYS